MTISKLHIALFLFITLLLSACSIEDRCISGSGDLKAKTVTLSEFTGVDLHLPGSVEIIKSNTFKVEIQARENILDLVRTDIISGKLRLDMDNRCIKGKSDLAFKVYTPELGYLRVAGSGNIKSEMLFPIRDWTIIIDGSGDINAQVNANKSEAIISGSGSMNLQGTADEMITRISGSGNIHAFGVTAKELRATISGSGNIEATATETLSATISGSGNIRYKGQPSITNVSISGSGKLIKVN